MTFKEFKNTEFYKNPNKTFAIDGDIKTNELISIMDRSHLLDNCIVIGTEHNADGSILIDLIYEKYNTDNKFVINVDMNHVVKEMTEYKMNTKTYNIGDIDIDVTIRDNETFVRFYDDYNQICFNETEIKETIKTLQEIFNK